MVQFKFDESSVLRCPTCKTPLKRVVQESRGMLNSEQFDAIKAGDYYCEACPGNDRGKSGLRYFWNSELGISVSL